MKQNSGSISVYSEPEKGSTFRVYLPGIQDATPDLQPQPRPKPPCGKGETLLLVEDEEAIRVTLSLFLRDLGYEVLDAGHPAQALQIMASRLQGVDALITDVVMPGMNGRDLAGKLREQRPELKVLFMSGYTGDVIANRGVLDSGVAFLSKPIMRHVLAKKIHELLNEVPVQKGAAGSQNEGGESCDW